MSDMVDAQFTVASPKGGTILRPFNGFEAVYEGQSATVPIALPGTLDERAGQRGFSRYLLAGRQCPLGSKAIFWLPAIAPVITVDSVPIFFNYFYVIHWRMRSIGDFGQENKGYHLGSQGFGAPDTTLNPNNPEQFVIPSATETVVYQQFEPGTPFPNAPGPGLGNLRAQLIAVPNDGNEVFNATGSLPFLPPNAAPNYPTPFPPAPPPFTANTKPKGVYSQGLADLSALPEASYSYYRPYFTIAKGDEYLLTVSRAPVELPQAAAGYQDVWNFKESPIAGLPPLDAELSNVFGTNVSGQGNGPHPPFPNLGVYAFFGSNPS